jgi:hypothetical protein
MGLRGPLRDSFNLRICVEVEVEFNLQLTVSRSVCLGAGIPSGSHDQISFMSLTIAGFLIWSTHLTRGWVCNLLVQLLLGLARSVTFVSKSHRTQTIFYCLIWDSPNLEGQVPVFISPRNRVAQLYPRALGSIFVVSYDSQDCGGGILTRLHTGLLGYVLVVATASLDKLHAQFKMLCLSILFQFVQQPYVSAAFNLRKIPGTHFCYRLSRPEAIVRLERLGELRKSNDLIGNRTGDLPACSTVLNQLR